MKFRNLTTYEIRRVKVFNPEASGARQKDRIPRAGGSVDFDLDAGNYTVEVYTDSDTAPAARITGVRADQVVRAHGGIGAAPTLTAVDQQQDYG